MTGDETVVENIVERMLYAGERFGGIVVFVVDVDISGADGIAHHGGNQVVVDEGFCCLGSEFHHHAGRRVCVHVGILASDVVVLRFDDLQEHVASLGAACYGALVAICNVAFGHLFSRTLHQFEFHFVLYLLDSHLFVAGHTYAVGNFLYEGFVFAEIGGEHGLAYGGFDFFFIVADDSAVAFDDCLYHFFVGVCVLDG